MYLSEFVDVAISTPFKIGGRDFDGWDCWGLVYCFYLHVFGVNVGSFSSEYDEKVTYDELSKLIDVEKERWIRAIGNPEIGDVSLYRVGKFRTHVGVVLPERKLLHCEARIGTVIEPLTTPIWHERHEAYYRFSR